VEGAVEQEEEEKGDCEQFQTNNQPLSQIKNLKWQKIYSTIYLWLINSSKRRKNDA